jgi:hypothetical protein
MSDVAGLCDWTGWDCYSVFKDFAAPTATIVAATVAAGLTFLIQYRQWRTAREKLRLDLFEKRYVYFMAARNFLSSIAREADMSYEALREFDIAMVGARFIFDQSVVEYIRKIRKVAFEAKRAEIDMADLNNPKRADIVQRKFNAILWLHEQLEELERVFSPHIGIGNGV